jgi:hypothetical protein
LLAWLKGRARAGINLVLQRPLRRYLLRYFVGDRPYSVMVVSALSEKEARSIGEALCREGKTIGYADDGSPPVEVPPVPGVFLAFVLDWGPTPGRRETNDIPF